MLMPLIVIPAYYRSELDRTLPARTALRYSLGLIRSSTTWLADLVLLKFIKDSRPCNAIKK
jgi:hypothetical protein